MLIFSIVLLFYTFLVYNKIIILNNTALLISSFIMGILMFFILGIISGRIENKNGWWAGLSSCLICFLIIFICKLFTDSVQFFDLVKYLCYLLASVLGGIIGVNIKNK